MVLSLGWPRVEALGLLGAALVVAGLQFSACATGGEIDGFYPYSTGGRGPDDSGSGGTEQVRTIDDDPGGAGPVMCGPGLELCSSICVDKQTDAQHCGECNRPCPGGYECSAGECTCPAGAEECSGECVDVTSSHDHCGGCDIACEPQERCAGSACVCDTTSGVYAACGAECVDTTTNPQHCGGCELACEPNWLCSDGQCVVTCPEDELRCDKSCVDPLTDALHCGACDTACDADSLCEAGLCVCGPGLANCRNECISVTSDPDNCGACGESCDPDSETCVDASCVCNETHTLCEDECVDVLKDHDHCSACGVECGRLQLCEGGVCVCREVGEMACGDECPNVTMDVNNCGECGVVCAANEQCSDGVCMRHGLEINTTTPRADNPGQIIQPQFEMCNTWTTDESLEGIDVRYWYSDDGTTGPQRVALDSVQVIQGNGQENVKGVGTIETVAGAPAGTTHVMVVAFTGTLPGGKCVQVSARIDAGYQEPYYDQENDWSNPEAANAPNFRMTIHVDGEVTWGCAPDRTGPHCDLVPEDPVPDAGVADDAGVTNDASVDGDAGAADEAGQGGGAGTAG